MPYAWRHRSVHGSAGEGRESGKPKPCVCTRGGAGFEHTHSRPWHAPAARCCSSMCCRSSPAQSSARRPGSSHPAASPTCCHWRPWLGGTGGYVPQASARVVKGWWLLCSTRRAGAPFPLANAHSPPSRVLCWLALVLYATPTCNPSHSACPCWEGAWCSRFSFSTFKLSPSPLHLG